MESNGVGRLLRRRSRAEADRLVSEFERSGQRRKEFCAAHGLAVHTLDAWRRRVAQSGAEEKIVPVEIVADRVVSAGWGRTGRGAWSGQFRIILAEGLRIEIERGFDTSELRRLIAALHEVDTGGSLPDRV